MVDGKLKTYRLHIRNNLKSILIFVNILKHMENTFLISNRSDT